MVCAMTAMRIAGRRQSTEAAIFSHCDWVSVSSKAICYLEANCYLAETFPKPIKGAGTLACRDCYCAPSQSTYRQSRSYSFHSSRLHSVMCSLVDQSCAIRSPRKRSRAVRHAPCPVNGITSVLARLLAQDLMDGQCGRLPQASRRPY